MTSNKIYRTILAIALVSVFIAPGCKKGEDDPFMSLRSRKARVSGEWKLSSGKSVDTYTSGSNTTVTTTTYNGTTADESVVFNNGTPVTSSAGYTQTLTIEKDGTFTLTEVDDGVTTTITGTWNFMSGVGDDSKKKERLIMYYENYTSGGNSTVITGELFSVVYSIRMLRNKEMVLDFNYSTSDSNFSDDRKSEWTYTQ